ncbi:MAG: TPM domain-containing protein [Phenylobacterium sp.]
MLTDDDRARVQAAVARAETGTRGEIFCIIVPDCGDYRETPLAVAAFAALSAPVLLLAGGIQVTVPGLIQGGWTAAAVGAAAGVAAREAVMGVILLQVFLFLLVLMLAWLPAVRRLLTPASLKRERVRRRAYEQFLSKNLQDTRERTGVLIFVSEWERMAELIADEGIASHVDPSVWDVAMSQLIEGVKAGQVADGFEAAIAICGDVLAEHFPPRESDNPNELPDHVVVIR